MDQQTIDKYNPNKFRELSKEDIEAMRNFTMNDVADLAKAYPNKPSERAYLVLFDKTDKARQLYPLATWANLFALWKQNLTKYVAFNFAALHNNKAVVAPNLKTGPVQDLTQAEVTKAIKTVPGKPQAKQPVTVKPLTAKAQTAKPFKPEKPGPAIEDFDSDSDYSDSDFGGSDTDFEQLEKEAADKTTKKETKKQPVKKKVTKKK